ncbi:MAG: gliding motility-associated protein GldE [Rhodothermia bacterium]|nr:MAG: gliding motility-associated protein GldE [Rhodothermia bacterium]
MESDQPPSHIAGLISSLSVQEVSLELAPFLIGATVLLVLLFLSALFSGSEVALLSLTPTEREQLGDDSDRSSRRVVRLLENPRALLVTILILNTFVNVGAAILAAILTRDLALAMSWSPTLTILGEVVALTFVLLVVSEISPKLLATRHSVIFSRRVSWLLITLHRFLYPVSSIIARSMNAFHHRFKSTNGRLPISGEDLKTMAEIGEAHGTIEEEERELIHSIVEFGSTSVREIMISRLDVVALPAGASIAEAIDVIKTTGHSRLPLYVEHLDNILGVVYAKDLLRYMTSHNKEGHIDWTNLARPPIFVPLGKKLDDLLRDFQDRKTHLALVVDEYGGTAGLVTLEDVLEEIVGEIRDEHDETERDPFEKLDENVYRFDARIDLDELNEVAGTHLQTDDFDFETLGGLIFHLAGKIPATGDSFKHRNLRIDVERVESHRIVDVLITVDPADELESVDINTPDNDPD